MCKVGLVSMHLEKVQNGIGLRNIKKKKNLQIHKAAFGGFTVRLPFIIFFFCDLY